MLTPKILNIILALQVLTALSIYVQALPITSKPIESTAEHLAWQAWLMLPPEQKNLEKSRKVTPKSIFTLPFRECPPGHQAFENRCIPTVNIDQKELLTQELLGFFVGSGGNTDINYDYEEYPPEEAEQDSMLYGGDAQKFSGGDGTYNYDQLPSQDEPLKFNIFQQKFPTDYEADLAPLEELDLEQEQTAKSANSNATTTTLAEAVNKLASKPEPSLNSTKPTTPKTITTTTITQHTNDSLLLDDLQMESSNVSTNMVPPQQQTITINTDSNSAHDIVTPTAATTTTTTSTFSISNIDAIVLPANMPTSSQQRLSDLESKGQNVHKFSLFKDDSSLQLVTSALQAEHDAGDNKRRRTQQANIQPDLTHLLKADDLLPLFNIAAPVSPASPESLETTVSTRTKSSPIAGDNEVSTLSSGSTIPLGTDNIEDSLVTEITPVRDAEATMPSLFSDLLGNSKEKFLDILEKQEDENKKKDEHARSVANQNENSENSASNQEPQEENFSTTTEADMTTNFQLDETTVNEMHDAPTIALKQLMELAPQQSSSTSFDYLREHIGGVVVKKSKVVPLLVPPPIPPTIESETNLSDMPTSSSTTAAKVSVSSSVSLTTTLPTIDTKAMMIEATTTPLTATSTTIKATKQDTDNVDRFHYGQLNINSEIPQDASISGDSNQSVERQDDEPPQLGDSNFRDTETASKTTTTTTHTTKATSEIDIKQELRMINELVKGSNNSNKKKQQQQNLKGGIIKSPTTTPTTATTISATSESGLTSEIKKSTPTISASSGNQDKVVGSSSERMVAVNEDEESRISITPTTTTVTQETTNAKAMPTTTTDSSTTIWSKIMPFLGFSSSLENENSTEERSTLVPSPSTTTLQLPKVEENSEMLTSSTTETSISSSNRSNRNSKIIRINNLSTPSFSSNTEKSLSSSSQFSLPITSTVTISDTDITDQSLSSSSSSTTSSSSSTSSVSSSPSLDSQAEPFWWLPIGWRLDRSSNEENDNEPSLLLRFWSAFPGSGLSRKQKK